MNIIHKHSLADSHIQAELQKILIIVFDLTSSVDLGIHCF